MHLLLMLCPNTKFLTPPSVPIPDYTGQKVCGLTVHFLPCDELQVTTSCHAYGSPEYPIKTPLHLPQPQSCPSKTSAR